MEEELCRTKEVDIKTKRRKNMNKGKKIRKKRKRED